MLTIKQKRVSVPEVEKSWKRSDAVALSERRILDLDHMDPVNVALVINVLQLFQDDVTGTAVGLVC